ncbi:coniferyl alcohol acyltransferase [Euphorbia lathyris]|uniref:coniferyl alcohol acyltransferase n=1 Tax=Euphorbia lathyris TaxID=212925 RepID=UPI00331316AB
MEAQVPNQRNFEVNLTKKRVVKASNHLPNSQVIALSNLDLLSGRFPVTYVYFYDNPQSASFSSIMESLANSLAENLSYYYPFAGRIVQNPVSNEPEIICDNNGALVVEGNANICLKNLDFYNLDKSLQGKLASITSDFPTQIQVIQYTCGSISITFSFDHALGDASAFSKFLLSWSNTALNKQSSFIPDHRRNLHPRCPPRYHPSLDRTFVKCSMEDIMNMPPNDILLKRLYHIDISNINHLQHIACSNGNKRTKIEAFSAYIWKIMVTAIDKKHERCKMGWLVDGRGRMHGAQTSFSNYIGNVLSIGVGEATVAEIKQASISDIATNVHETILKVANQEHFMDLIDWIECHRPGLMLPYIVLGRGGPAVVLSSGRRFPVAELNFGFGSPVLGTVSSTIQRIGVAYLNQRPSARGDGSWTVSAILWPELAAALESDSIFEPMTASHLLL